jgi:hypothetical protein
MLTAAVSRSSPSSFHSTLPHNIVVISPHLYTTVVISPHNLTHTTTIAVTSHSHSQHPATGAPLRPIARVRYSGTRHVGEITNIAYGCFPRVDSAGRPVLGGGLELIVASRASIPGDTDLSEADALLQDTVKRVVAHIDSVS